MGRFEYRPQIHNNTLVKIGQTKTTANIYIHQTAYKLVILLLAYIKGLLLLNRKKQLEQLTGIQIVELMEKYNIPMDCKRSEAIERILAYEKPPKQTRPPRNAATTKLKAVRIQTGITQKQLADAAGLNLRTLQHYEQGVKTFDNAHISVILSICNALNCTYADIIENADYIQVFNEYMERVK